MILDNKNGLTYDKKMFEPLLHERVVSVKIPDAKIEVKYVKYVGQLLAGPNLPTYFKCI